MKNTKQTKQDFCLWVNNCRNKYLDLILNSTGNATAQEIHKEIKEFEEFYLKDVSMLKCLDINNLLFFASFNNDVKNDPNVEEYVALKVLSKNEEANLHMLAAFLANTDTIDNIVYDCINEFVKYLCERVQREPGYCFELPFLKTIQSKFNVFIDECTEMLHELACTEEYVEAKKVEKLLKSAISTSILNKAEYLGWRIVK